MNILLVPDKFKDALAASEVIAALRSGIHEFNPDFNIHSACLSDGGDGFLSAVKAALPEVQHQHVVCRDPLNRPLESYYYVHRDTASAYIELAKASGLELLTNEERNGLYTTTLGTGMLIKDALNQGVKKIFVGLGGSATSDGGTGLATALGYQFLDKSGVGLRPGAAYLKDLFRILPASNIAEDIRMYAVNDVTNPLTGPQGAAIVYGKQKGIPEDELVQTDKNLLHLHAIVKRDLGIDAKDIPGSGAAGGTGYGLKCFLDAEFISGVDFMFDLNNLQGLLSASDIDLIITGEGKIDEQTAYGKLVSGVSRVAAAYNIPVIAVCGITTILPEDAGALGLQKIIPVAHPDKPLTYNLENAAMLTRNAIFQYLRSIV